MQYEKKNTYNEKFVRILYFEVRIEDVFRAVGKLLSIWFHLQFVPLILLKDLYFYVEPNLY